MQDETIMIQINEDENHIQGIEMFEDKIDNEEKVEYVPIDEPETFEIEIQEKIASFGDSGGITNHNDLGGRDISDQHPIGAIIGLQKELDEIKRLKTVYSNGKNQANYYLWEDENPLKENRSGYFVSVHQNDNKIRICSATEDEFGVTVDTAGFIGGQDDILRNESYGLVVHSGVVGVRCESNVAVGDYVTSNDYGMAQKSNGTYGYLVTAISDVEGVTCAVISLTMPTTQMQNFSEITQDVAERMDSAETNIATAISVANAAYNKAQIAQEWTQDNVENIAGEVVIIGGKVDDIVGDMNELSESIAGADLRANEAYNMANQAQAQAETIRAEVVKTANEAQASVNDLIQDVGPITTWTNENGDKGAEYFVEHMNNNLATKTEVYTVEKLTENNSTAISKNAEKIELLATSIDKYSVGEYSQAYGLTWEQAKSILKKEMLYIPTVEHDEYYDGYPTDDNRHEFTRGYYYTWNGNYWVESESPFVYFSDAYVLPSEECKYWYRETNEDLKYTDEVTGDTIVYEANSLYVLIDNKWTKVNMLSGNITNRATSMLIQTATEIAADVTNSRGWLAHMGVRITEDGSFADSIASTVSQTTYKIADGQAYASMDDIPGPMSGKYYAIGSVAPYDIYTWDGEKFNAEPMFYDGVYIMKPNTASIITAANKYGDTSIALNADRINFDGVVTFTQDNSGITTIKGGGIRSGYIASNNFKQVGHIVESGTLFNLNDGTISTPNFYLDKYGNVSMAGRISATSGYIADFIIDHVDNWYCFDELTPDNQYYFIFDNINYYFIAPSDITPDNVLLFTTATPEPMLVCGEIIIEYDNREIIPNNTQLITLIQGHSYIANNQYKLTGSEFDSDGKPYNGVYIAPDGIGLGNGNFYVDNNGTLSTKGNVFMMNDSGEPLLSLENGSIKLSGSITWGANSSPTLVLYGQESYSVNSPNYANAPQDSAVTWHKRCSENDLYAIYSYDGGNTWTPYPIRFRGEKGDKGDTGASGAELTDTELFNILTDNGSTTGIFPFATGNGDDKLYINANYIKSGEISTNLLKVGILDGFTIKSTDAGGHIIQMSDGNISLYPDASSKPKIKIAFNTSSSYSDPYIQLGAGSVTYDSFMDGIPVTKGTGILYKVGDLFGLKLNGSDGKTQGIWFYDNASESYISFGNSIIDFQGAEIRNFSGDSGGTATAVFG